MASLTSATRLIPSISMAVLRFGPSLLSTVGACSGTHPVGPGLGAMAEGFSAGSIGITLRSKPGWAIARSVRTFDSGLVSPGEVVLEEFPRPMGISQVRLALATGVSQSSLCRFFGLSNGFWLRMHAWHDLKWVRRDWVLFLAGLSASSCRWHEDGTNIRLIFNQADFRWDEDGPGE
jgi:hypothetical protein